MTFPSTEAEPLSSLPPAFLALRRLDRGFSITSAITILSGGRLGAHTQL